MKARGRSLMWWPCIDHDIERTVKTCDTCMRSRPRSTEVALQPWSLVDLGPDISPFVGKMVMVVIDAHSKWIDAHITPDST